MPTVEPSADLNCGYCLFLLQYKCHTSCNHGVDRYLFLWYPLNMVDSDQPRLCGTSLTASNILTNVRRMLDRISNFFILPYFTFYCYCRSILCFIFDILVYWSSNLSNLMYCSVVVLQVCLQDAVMHSGEIF